jgi:electron transport complex protein RnfD
VLGTLALLAAIFNQIDPAHYPSPLLHLLGGSALMCAFFIATDPVGAPVTPLGRTIYGAGIGALIYIIRTWGGYPEGVAFAVLLMNAATPLIDHLVRPRRYGRLRSGAPLPVVRGEDGQ